MARNDRVTRPTKKGEYELRFATRQAEKNYPLRGDLATVIDGGEECQRWQHKPTARGDARIWFFVRKKTVYLEAVHTHHPHQTN